MSDHAGGEQIAIPQQARHRHARGPRQDFGRGAFLHDASPAHHRHAVGQNRKMRIVTDRKRGQTEFMDLGDQLGHDFIARGGVERRGRFIQQQQLRLAR